MGNRGGWGLLIILGLAISTTVMGQSGLLYLNGEPLSLEGEILQQDGELQLPLVEFGLRLGLGIDVDEGWVTVRGMRQRLSLEASTLLTRDDRLYAELEWLLSFVDGSLHQVGGDTYVETRPARLMGIDVSSHAIVLRWSGFTQHESSISKHALSDVLYVHWPHARLEIDSHVVRVGESDIQEVRLTESSDGVQLTIALEAGTALATHQVDAESAYVLTLTVADSATTESVIRLQSDWAVHEWRSESSERAMQAIYVSSWRARYRLSPSVPTENLVQPAPLENLQASCGGVAAVSLRCPSDPAGCLVIDGIPYAIPQTPEHVLGVDIFGRWNVFSSLCTTSLKHAGRALSVEGVNRPLAYGEVVVYSPGYSGDVARGVPGSFTALKIREDRVVSVYHGPFVPEDPSAILVVASGEAKARLSLIQLGDPIELICDFVHAASSYSQAVSTGPLLIADGLIQAVDTLGPDSEILHGGTLLASDWQGGLYFLAFSSDETAAEPWRLSDVVSVLDTLPTSLKDAVLLSACPQASLSYTTDAGTYLLGARTPYSLALSLIPLAP